jgi:hypothetical protein
MTNPIVEDGTDPKYTAMVALNHALYQHPLEFETTVNGMLADRIQDAVEKKREEVAKSVFNGEEPKVASDDGNSEEEDGTTETSEHEPKVEETPSGE